MNLVPRRKEIEQAFRDWLADYLARNGLTLYKFTCKVGMDQAGIYQLRNGRRQLTDQKAESIFETLALDYDDAVWPFLEKILQDRERSK